MKISIAFITALVAAMSLCACGPRSNPDDFKMPEIKMPDIQITPPDFKPDTTCEEIKSTFGDESVNMIASEKLYQVERHFQRVIRRDCDGNVTSDKVETVRSPLVDLTLKAPNKKSFESVFVFNATSCDHKLTTMPIVNFPIVGQLFSVTGDGKSEIEIKGDLVDAFFTFHLKEGPNKIFVRYYHDCSPRSVKGNLHASNGEGNCDEATDTTTALYPITINYKEKTLEGFSEVNPSEEQCKASSQQAAK